MGPQREKLSSRLGFIMLSAGCAIVCGNVWKFPWMCGQYGGGGFLLVYILCLLNWCPMDATKTTAISSRIFLSWNS